MPRKSNAEYQREYRARKAAERLAAEDTVAATPLAPESVDPPIFPVEEDDPPIFGDTSSGLPRSNYNLPGWPEAIQSLTQHQRDQILDRIATPRRTPR